MKKIFLLLLVSLAWLSAAQVQAQDPYTKLFSGMRAGIGVTQLATSVKVDSIVVNGIRYDSASTNHNSRARFGFQAGFFVQKQFNERIGVRADLLYSESGGSYQVKINKFERHSLRYFQFQPSVIVNVAPKASFNRFFVKAAPVVRLLASAHVEDIDQELSRNYAKFDYGATLGVTYMIQISRYVWLTLDAEGYYGFANVEKNNREVVNTKNRGINWGAGFAIPIK
jgi:hypothetical protein